MQARASAIQRWWAYVNKKSGRSVACSELFIETDYCATNATLLRNACGRTPRSVGHSAVHKRNAHFPHLPASLFHDRCTRAAGQKIPTPYTNEDAKTGGPTYLVELASTAPALSLSEKTTLILLESIFLSRSLFHVNLFYLPIVPETDYLFVGDTDE